MSPSRNWFQSWIPRKGVSRFVLIPTVILDGCWMLLYLPHLRTSPGWYGDETNTLLMGHSIVKGDPALGPIWLTYWHSFVPYFPGYLAGAGAFSALTSNDITGARLFNTLLALATSFVIFFQGRARFGILPSLLGALVFLSYFQDVIHFRWVYPHNAVALGFAILAVYLIRKPSSRNDWMAGTGLAVAALAHPLFSHGAIGAFLSRLTHPKSWFRLAIPPAIVLTLTVTFIILKQGPTWLIDDFHKLVSFYSEYSEENGGGFKVFQNISLFYTQDIFHLGAIVFLIFAFRRRYFPLAITLATVSFLLLRNRQNLTIFYYQAIILTPLLSLLWALGGASVGRILRRRLHSRHVQRTLLYGAFIFPFSLAVIQLPAILSGKLMPKNQLWVTQSTEEVDNAAAWLNKQTTTDDLVIANSNLSWLLHAKSADLMQATLWRGVPTVFFPGGLNRDRFRYPVDVKSAKYVVIGDIDQVWTLGQENITETLRGADLEKWPIVWQGRYYLIVENPAFTGAAQKTATPSADSAPEPPAQSP